MDVRHLIPRDGSELQSVALFAKQMALIHGGSVLVADPSVCPPRFYHSSETTLDVLAADDSFSDGFLVVWDKNTLLEGDLFALQRSCESLRGRRVVIHLLDMGESLDLHDPTTAKIFTLFAERDRKIARDNVHLEKRVIAEIVKRSAGKKVVLVKKRKYNLMTEETKAAIRDMRRKGFTYLEISQKHQVSISRVYKHARDVRSDFYSPLSRMRTPNNLGNVQREVQRISRVIEKYEKLSKLFADYFKTLSPSCVRIYGPNLTSLVHWCEKKGCLKDYPNFLNEDILEHWLCDVKKNRSPRTMIGFVAAVRSFLRYLKRRGLIEHEPVVFAGHDIIDDGIVKTQPLTEEEFVGMLATARQKWQIMKAQPDKPIATQLAHRNYILVLLLASLGARSGSIIELRKCDWDGVSVNIRQKRRHSSLAFRLPDEVAEEFNHYVKTYFDEWHGSSWLFPVSMKRTSHLTSGDVTSIIRGLTKDAGIKRRITSHMFRVTFALICHRNGMNMHELKNRLAHLDLRMTSAYLRRIDLSKDNKYLPNVVSISKGMKSGPILTGA